jgi:hypothetical protein
MAARALRWVFTSIVIAACGDDVDDVASGSGSGSGGETTMGEGSTGSTGGTAPSTGTASASGQSTENASSSSSDSGSSESGLVMNACGTFDPNRPGDSVIPQDPDDPEIVAACTSLCEALANVPECTTDPTPCLDACKLRSCNICPGTLVPLVECETEMFAADGCSCGRVGAECPTPEGCRELLSDTNACGG